MPGVGVSCYLPAAAGVTFVEEFNSGGMMDEPRGVDVLVNRSGNMGNGARLSLVDGTKEALLCKLLYLIGLRLILPPY